MNETIRFILNGKPVTLDTGPDRILLWVLRTDLGLTGTKYGCGEGMCGSCTVILNGRAVRACQTTLATVRGQSVTTIEGLVRDGEPHPLQRAFAEHGALQCGYCTPGMIMGAYGLLLQHRRPTRAEIIRGMEAHLCRCGAHRRIIQAIEAASGTEAGHD